MRPALVWTLVVSVAAPSVAWADSPHTLNELEASVLEFCADREALTKASVASSKTDQRFQLANSIEEHRRKDRDLNDRADELRSAANGAVLSSIVRLESMHRNLSNARAQLAQLTAQLNACASFDDGFITWAAQRMQTIGEEEQRTNAQSLSDEAYFRHIARGVTDAQSFEERVVQITTPTFEQTLSLYTDVNPERFVFAARPLDEVGAPGRIARHRRVAAGEALLLTSAPRDGRVQILTIEGLQFDVDVRGISLTPLKGKKAAPIEPGWLIATDQATAYMPLIPAVARLTGLFPLKR